MPIHTTNQPRTNSDGVCTVNDAMQFSAAKICLMVIKICAAWRIKAKLTEIYSKQSRDFLASYNIIFLLTKSANSHWCGMIYFAWIFSFILGASKDRQEKCQKCWRLDKVKAESF